MNNSNKLILILNVMLALFFSNKLIAATDTLLFQNAQWRYLDNGTNQGSAWRSIAFVDTSWKIGFAELGYGDGGEATIVSYGPSAKYKYITTYFRKKFTVPNPQQYTSLTLDLLRDDGAVVYLNGTLVLSDNMPTSGVTFKTLALNDVSGAAENTFYSYSIPTSLLMSGNNILSVEIHQRRQGNSDISFNCRLRADHTPCMVDSATSVTNIGITQATLHWDTAAALYDMRYKRATDTTWTEMIDINASTFNLNTLLPATTYNWQVRKNCLVSKSQYTTGSDFTTLPVCDVPIGLKIAFPTANSAIVSFLPVSGALSYVVEYRGIGASWVSHTITGTSITLTGLQQARTYEVRVAAICAGGGSNYSPSVSFTTIQTSQLIDTIFYSGTSWKYLDNGSNQDTAWQELTFNDQAWSQGNAQLGYGDGDETTVVSYGSSNTNKYVTTYFRKKFYVSNPSQYSFMRIQLLRDDGAVVYINGNEVARSNMPTGIIRDTTLASSAISGAGESTYYPFTFAPGFLQNDTNVIAVEIHQNARNSSDISFNMLLEGVTTLPVTNLLRGPYLQLVTPNAITVRWRTDLASPSRVRYGADMALSNTVDSSTAKTDHEVRITGLNPKTRYYYCIGSHAEDLQGDTANTFVTMPVYGDSGLIRVWVTGDFGNNSNTQDTVAKRMEEYTANKGTDFWLWLGDNAYNTGTEAEYTTNVFARYPKQFKRIPVYPSLGNHDYGNAGYLGSLAMSYSAHYFSAFTVPTNGEAGGLASGTEKYYSYNYGNAHFIALDSYGSFSAPGSPMYNWLQSDLAANTKRFTIVYFHHPPYTMGTHNSDSETELIAIRNNIVPLLELYHVDVVYSGHSHNYERSVLMQGHYGLENTFNATHVMDSSSGMSPPYLKASPNFYGTVYQVIGCSGKGGSVTVQSAWPHNAMYSYANTLYGSGILEIEGDTLHSKFLTSTGIIYDQFKIVKSGAQRYGQIIFYPDMEELLCFPNPSNDNCTLQFNSGENEKYTVTIYAPDGRELCSKVFQAQLTGMQQLELDANDFKQAKGIVLIKVVGKSKVYSRKLQRL